MTEGFVIDVTHGAYGVSSWVEGAPQKSVWTGVKVTGRPRSEIATWRCGRCGFLESYAVAAPDRSHEAKQRTQVVLVLAIVTAVLVALLGVILLLR